MKKFCLLLGLLCLISLVSCSKKSDTSESKNQSSENVTEFKEEGVAVAEKADSSFENDNTSPAQSEKEDSEEVLQQEEVEIIEEPEEPVVVEKKPVPKPVVSKEEVPQEESKSAGYVPYTDVDRLEKDIFPEEEITEEEKLIEEQQKLALEQKKLEEEQKKQELEQQKLLEEEKQRELEQQKLLEEENRRKAEQQKLAEEEKQRELEQQRLAEEQKKLEAEKQQLTEEEKRAAAEKAEQERLAEEQRQREAEQQRIEEEKRQREREKQRVIEEQQRREKEEQKRLEEQKRREKEEQERLAEQKRLEEERLKAEERAKNKDLAEKEEIIRKVEEEEIVLLPPDPVSSIKGEFDWKKNKVTITWENPDTYGFSYVELKNNKTGEVINVSKRITSYTFIPEGKEDYTFTLTPVNVMEDRGTQQVCTVEKPYILDSIFIPETANTGSGNTFDATVKGANFIKLGLKEKDFKVKCNENTTITKTSKVKIIDDETLHISLTIPDVADIFTIQVSCGPFDLTGNLTVYNYSSYIIGQIMRVGETPVAVIAGFDQLGFPFGLAFEENTAKAWADDNAYGYNNSIDELVCIPSVLGTASARKATFSGDIYGADNCSVIIETDPGCKNKDGSLNRKYFKENYPLFDYALNYGETANIPEEYKDGWYIPSLYELCQIYKNNEAINKSLYINKGVRISDDFYWSSSQSDNRGYYGCAVRFSNGNIYKFYSKSYLYSARCVRSFKEEKKRVTE